MINNTENISQFLKPVAYLIGLLINVFFENWQGQKIIDSSEKVFESAYVLYIINSSTFTKSQNHKSHTNL